jgi:hypothetical protein
MLAALKFYDYEAVKERVNPEKLEEFVRLIEEMQVCSHYQVLTA